MAFNPGSYQGAISSQLKSRGALSRGMSSALSGQQKFKEFSLDEQNKYAKLQKKAGSVFSNWKRGLSLVAGLAATAMGLGPVAAGLMAGVGTATGGAIGKGKAGKQLGKSKYFKGMTSETSEAMGGTILKDSLLSAAMAYGAGTLREAGAAAREAEQISELGFESKEALMAEKSKQIAEAAELENISDWKQLGFESKDAMIAEKASQEATMLKDWGFESKDALMVERNKQLAESADWKQLGFSSEAEMIAEKNTQLSSLMDNPARPAGMDDPLAGMELFDESELENIYSTPQDFTAKALGKTAGKRNYFGGMQDLKDSTMQNLGDVFRGGKVKYGEVVGNKGFLGDAKGIFNTGTSMMNMFNAVNKGMNRRR